MRLTTLDLTAYGHFSNARLVLPRPASGAPDLHIVYGPNEAGKSTLLAAWLDLLFGFPNVTPYDFLHDKRALRVQAELCDATGRVHALARIKGNQNTLLDARTDQPLPEAVMAGLLEGLNRAAYGTMFSLDDATLVRGAQSIMASEGELGALLFQGTAGLAELGVRMRQMRAQADDWFSPRKRKTVLAEHKVRLAELKDQRRDVDLTLGAWRKLTEAVERAEDLHRTAEHAQRDVLVQHQAVQRDLDAFPILTRLRRTQDELAKLPVLRDIPADWRAALPHWQTEDAALAALLPTAMQELEHAQIALDAEQVDHAALPYLPQMDALERDFGAVSAGLADLPKRESELALVLDQMTTLAVRLGKGTVDPETLILPAPLAASLADQITLAAQLSIQRTSAEVEVARAKDALGTAQAKLPDGGDIVPDLGPLADLLDQIRSADPLRAVANADTELRRTAATLTNALAVLTPWHGDEQALVALVLPGVATLRALQSDMNVRHDDLRAAIAVQKQSEHAVARGKASLGHAETPDPADLVACRAVRDSAWHRHKTALSPDTATAFEVAMLADDRQQAQALTGARIFERAETLRADMAGLGSATIAVVFAQAAVAAAQAQVADFWAQITQGPALSMTDLIDWSMQRGRALECLAARDQAKAAHMAAVSAVDTWDRALAALVPMDKVTGGFAACLASAQAMLTKATATQQARDAVTAAVADLRLRTKAHEAILAAQRAWQDQWHALLSRAGWGADPVPDVVQMRAILGALSDLPAMAEKATNLQHRIDRIVQDSNDFFAVIRDIARALDEPVDPDLRRLWPRLRDRLRHAREGVEAQARLVQDVQRKQAQVLALRRRRTTLDAATATLRAAFVGQSLAQIADTFGQLALAGTLHDQANDLRADLTALLRCDDLPSEFARLDALDVVTLRADEAALKAAVIEHQTAFQSAFALLIAARRDCDAVGSDARAAKLDEDRQTLLLQIGAEAQDYLAQQAALLAIDAALRAYRETHRSSMMDRAGAAFRVLTGGKYSGLGTQPSGDSEVLIAQHQGGAAKVVDTLSKGTAFQLYLALRIAGYQELADQRPMVPFIADDIMESFDDDRAGAAFGLLGQMAQRGQVIYLTHHAHLCVIARAACPDVQVHDLRAL